MVFDTDEEREHLIVELRRIGAPDNVVSWLDEPGTEVSTLGWAHAVAWWDDALRPAAERGEIPDDPAFSLAVAAYVEAWHQEFEQQELFAAARRLAEAAEERYEGRPAEG